MANIAAGRRARGAPLDGLAARIWSAPFVLRVRGGLLAAGAAATLVALASWRPGDPSLNVAAGERARNLLGEGGAVLADALMQSLGVSAALAALTALACGLARTLAADPVASRGRLRLRALAAAFAVLLAAAALAAAPAPAAWPLARSLGGFWGAFVTDGLARLLAHAHVPFARLAVGAVAGVGALGLFGWAVGLGRRDLALAGGWAASGGAGAASAASRFALARLAKRDAPPSAKPGTASKPVRAGALSAVLAAADAAPDTRVATREPLGDPEIEGEDDTDGEAADDGSLAAALADSPLAVAPPRGASRPSGREARESQKAFGFVQPDGFQLPELAMLAKPKPRANAYDEGALRQNARLLEGVLAEFGVKGQIDQIRPGPVVTLYELAPAPGVKSSRVISLADDIARSMSARSARVSVVSGRNAIGIELPNAKRETVYLRDLLASAEYEKTGPNLPMALGETIGGEPYIADLSKMPHLLIAGTTGSGKSVGVNAMILSILYRLPPSQCRFIMIDPKMLELSVYDGIPHLLAPVVTDPKKAIVALKWTVREMENRYRLMSKIGVRNVGGYNEKAKDAIAKGERFARTVQTGFDEAGRPTYETEEFEPQPMPFLVVVIDEVADLMMVAGKDIEGAVQRLAQMARAAGIHLIMATQRPSVDVITGTIKANFPTRISFQVTSKIDARTILGEQGAEQLLGQGDMLYMAGGGRIQRLHGPFVGDGEVEDVAKFLRAQGQPQYLEEITAASDGEDDEGGDPLGGGLDGEGAGADLYDHAVAVVTRDRKASTSYVQRRLQIGYNRAASLIERMEKEGVVGAPNHAGKREVLVPPPPPA